MKMKPIEWLDGAIRLLDQSKLPLEESYIQTADWRVLADAVRTMKVRGAPLIGITAAYAVALAAAEFSRSSRSDFRPSLERVLQDLARTRPTAVNLFWALDRMGQVLHAAEGPEAAPGALLAEALSIHRDDRLRCARISSFGEKLIREGSSVLTHCNAGALATGGDGTALGIIRAAHAKGNIANVFVDETRPLLQGARLTAWELMKEGIPATLITDSTAGALMAAGRIDCILVGADRIAANGDTANKVGTYSLAVLARYHGVPLYVAAPTTTIDPATATGGSIVIEERAAAEVTEVLGRAVAPVGVRVYNPAFDVTPGALITAIVTDEGIRRPPYAFSQPATAGPGRT